MAKVPEDWDGTLWRKPDEHSGDYWAVWYGPGGVDGEYATEVEADVGGYTVREYSDVTGTITPDDPDEPVLVTQTYIWDDDLVEAIDELGIKPPKKDLDWLRLAVGYGVAYMHEWGGEESWTDELPH
jgi:hypothetical protein